MIEIARVALLASSTVAFCALLVWHAVAGPPKRFSWGMFAQTRYCYFYLEVETEQGRKPFNLLAHLEVQNLLIDGWALAVLLEYFVDIHGIELSGHVILTDGVVRWRLEFRNGRMVSYRELST